jgi:hypothetical protein
MSVTVTALNIFVNVRPATRRAATLQLGASQLQSLGEDNKISSSLGK